MITLHHVQYGRSFRVLWLIEEIGVERFGGLRIVEHRIGTKEMATSGLARVSPAIRVPAIELDGVAMSESGAIVTYLCETRAPELIVPPGDPARPRLLEWLHYAETMASLIEQLNLQLIFLRPPAKPSPTVIKITVARLRQTLAGMEARLGDRDWLMGERFSAADIMMGFNLFAAPYFVPLDAFPRLLAYKARMEARPAYGRAVEREGAQRFYEQPFYPVPEA